MIMSIAPPKPGECNYNGRFGNYCHRPGIPERGGLCYWHSNVPKTREKFIEEYSTTNTFEGVVISNLDLSNLDLTNIFFRGFTAYHCVFDNSNLSHAIMSMAVFEGCNFSKANLSHVDAALATMTNCIFWNANMEEANLLSADLTNSDFAQANLQGSRIGLGSFIITPGVGNPERHSTRIDGARFKNARLHGIHLDPVYYNAPNLQEPLYQVWLDETEILLNTAQSAQTNKEKKETLEELTRRVIEKIPGLIVQDMDKRRLSDEIDLIVRNQSQELLNAGLSGPIFIECKNVSAPVGSEVVKKLAGAVPNNGVGVIVTTNKLTSDAKKEMRIQMEKNSTKNLRLSFLDKSDLEKIVSGEDKSFDRLVERYYYIWGL